MEQSNEELMKKYASDHKEAFDEIYKRFYYRIYNYFLPKVKVPEIAKDLTQEFFKKIHLHKKDFDPERKLENWFFKIAHNIFSSHYRYSKIREHLPFDENINCLECENSETCMPLILDAIEYLPQIQKKALLMRFFDDCPYDEISRTINKTNTNSRKIVSRAILKLKEAINF